MRGCGLTLVRPPPFPGPRRLSQVGSPEQPTVFTIPAHRAFADALAAGLLAQHGGDRMALARGIILVPTNRAARAISEAFVRRAETGLLLPRLVPLGDLDLDEKLGSALDPIGEDVDIPSAIAPMERQMILARMVVRKSTSRNSIHQCAPRIPSFVLHK